MAGSVDPSRAQCQEISIRRTSRTGCCGAPDIRLRDQHGEIFDVATLLAKGPVFVTFYRGGWCPFCNLELNAYQAVLSRIAAAGASIVAIKVRA